MIKENKPGAVQKAKRSLYKSQIRAIVILIAVALLLGVACGVVMYIVRQDIDVYGEIISYSSTGEDKYAYYYSRRDGSGFAVYDESDNKLTPFEYEKKLCYETKGGAILTLDENGMFEAIAVLDNGDGETINSSNTALLLYARIERAEIKSIEATNKKGGWRIYSVYEDTDGDGVKETNFYISGYENSPVSPTLLSAIVTRCGIFSLTVKLDREKMKEEDEKHKNDEGYIPILNADGSVNFEIYGLGATYTEKNEETGETETKETPNFVLEDKYGNVHKVYVGDLSADGAYYYVRYENIKSAVLDSLTASAAEKEQEQKKIDAIEKNVYLLAKDPSASSGFTSDFQNTILASAADISAPTVINSFTTSNYYDVRNFTVSRRDGDDFKRVICFSYDDLFSRMNTIRQDIVFHIVDAKELGVDGYEMDSDRTFDALYALTNISAASTDVTGTNTSSNYIKTVALVSSKVNDLSKVTEELIASDPEVRESMLALYNYGLLEAEYILSYDSPLNINDPDSMIISQAITISKRTENDTYYVWAPVFNQIVEIGAQYLNFIEYDTFDWVDRDLFHTMIAFSDGLRVTADGFDAIFEIFQKISVQTQQSFSSSSQNYYAANIDTDEYGNRRITISSNIVYTAQYADGSTSSKTHTVTVMDLTLSTVKNYCRMLAGEDISGLTGDELAAVERYKKMVNEKTVANGAVSLTHKVTAAGDSYGYVADTDFLFVFNYSNGNLSLTAKQVGKATTRTLYDEKTFSNYFAYYIDDKNQALDLTDDELLAVRNLFLTVQRVKTVETRVTVSINGGEPKDISVDTFKDLYIELIEISFYGRADKTDAAGGIVLTEAQMNELRESDEHSLKIVFYSSVGEDIVYRAYDYSPTKTFTTINGNGCFYINKITKDSFIKNAVSIANGGSLVQ